MSVFIAVAGSVALAASATGANDRPTIAPWTKIGDVGLGMVATRVVYEYGDLSPGGAGTSFGFYRVPGGRLDVIIHDGRVRDISTTSPRYVTPDGVRVGAKIPLGTLVGGHYRWKGFTYEPESGIAAGIWMKYSRRGSERLLAKLWTGDSGFGGVPRRPPGVISQIEIEIY